MKRVWLFLLLCSCGSDQQKLRPLEKMDRFAVMPVICSTELDNKVLIKQFITALEKVGTVSIGEIVHVPVALIFWLGNIGEERRINMPKGKLGDRALYFPVIWGSLQLRAEVMMLSNHAETDCNIWRKDLYFEEEESKEMTTEKAVGYMQDLVQRFADDYSKDNGPTARPHFYLSLIELEADETVE
jgi:hypothetical protein